MIFFADTVIANFAPRTCNGEVQMDTVISTNPLVHDLQFPMYVSGVTLESTVAKSNFAHFHRSHPGLVNPSDCVDMDCDGMKKNFITDVDGSFLGRYPISSSAIHCRVKGCSLSRRQHGEVTVNEPTCTDNSVTEVGRLLQLWKDLDNHLPLGEQWEVLKKSHSQAVCCTLVFCTNGEPQWQCLYFIKSFVKSYSAI